MIPNIQKRHDTREAASAKPVGSRGLQVTLWTLWTCTVLATAYLSWRADFEAQQPLKLPGLIIHCLLVGLIGLIVMTAIEMRLEPWRFLD